MMSTAVHMSKAQVDAVEAAVIGQRSQPPFQAAREAYWKRFPSCLDRSMTLES